ncbi:amino acid permease [Clostridium estertheticum]|uniref:APC family permease n=1 Tax=Clostridium estertheticum TaxID=238834 RepID=UPI0013E988AE|nr:amino acid permease [Clostridium estertheticum]MBZ9685842.1 amino acid permease [Clostridium estertheticum]
MSKEKTEKLKRSMNTFEGMMFVIGLVIGSGVFLKPAVVLKNMGSTGSSILIWIVGGVITTAAALTVAEITGYIPKVGGMIAYLAELYNDKISFLFGWISTFINMPASVAANAIAFAIFSTFFIPLTGMQQKILAVSLVVLLAVAQIISTRYGVWLQTVATIGKLLPMALIVIFGLLHGTTSHINMELVGDLKNGSPAVALLGVLWAYDGWLSVCSLADDMKRPAKDLPKAIIIGIGLVMVVYVTFNLAIFHVLPGNVAVNSSKIGVDVSTILFGKSGAIFITIGMMLSVFGCMNGLLACGSRYAYAMGQRKQLPGSKALSEVNSKQGTPINAILLESIVAILYVVTGTFNSITDMVVFVLWIFYTLGIIGVFILRKRVVHNPELYHVPLYPITPIIGAVGGMYLIFATIKDSPISAIVGTGLTLIGLPVYYYYNKKNKKDAENQDIVL